MTITPMTGVHKRLNASGGSRRFLKSMVLGRRRKRVVTHILEMLEGTAASLLAYRDQRPAFMATAEVNEYWDSAIRFFAACGYMAKGTRNDDEADGDLILFEKVVEQKTCAPWDLNLISEDEKVWEAGNY